MNTRFLSLIGIGLFSGAALTAVALPRFAPTLPAARAQKAVAVTVSDAQSDESTGAFSPADEESPVLRCGTQPPTPVEKAGNDALVSRFLTSHKFYPRSAGTVTIKVRFHIVYQTDGTGNISDDAIYAQLKALNAGYAGRDVPSTRRGQGNSAQPTANTPFRFVIAGIDRTANNSWAASGAGSSTFNTMATALAVNPRTEANVYITTNFNYLGVATLPNGSNSPTAAWIQCYYGTFPNTPSVNSTILLYKGGDTLTHEMGHWLGLQHVFSDATNGSCTDGNDGIADTPAQKTADFNIYTAATTDAGLPDSCPSDPGRDPVENIMGYGPDYGIYQFTPGQSARMDTQQAALRQ